MDRKQVINQRQLAWLASSVITSGGILTLQNVLIRVSEMDAWFSYILSIFYIFVIAAFFGYLVKMFPQRNIFEISMLLLGRWGGTVVNLLILFHFWQILVQDMSSASKYNSTLLLHNTPLEILVLVPCLYLIYFGRSSVEIVARVNDMFYPLFVIATLLMPLLLSNEFNLQLSMPVLTMPFQQLAFSNLLTIGSAGDIFILGAFLHMLFNANHIRSAIRYGSLLGIFLFTLIIFLILTVLGPKMPANFIYPFYNLVQMIHVTDFLDRLDIVLLTIWLPVLACKMIAIYLAILLGISSIIKERNYPIINKQVALLVGFTTILSFKSITELLAFANFSMPIIVLAYQPLVIGILFAASKIKQRKQAHQVVATGGSANSTVTPTQQTTKITVRFSYKQWVWLGNILMVFSTFCIAIGLAFGKYYPIIGTACALCFGSCLFLTLLTTYMEVNVSKQSEAGK
ncbi:spore germination protein (amino acid permease) [Paenibacillus sp. yr247]|uniref:GerAB/ArcD/ProY family transporter n=1 Tax=Paenibacillus sp. yr247 TaxID=1761880 RepID=UPI0008894D56|nr:endospore germination permease [Paenibacillus sp. yr247]SDN36870.1 spore germination protein (amino acid permease) [Paenibacillus sp. yr247]